MKNESSMKNEYTEDQKAAYTALREKARAQHMTRWEHLLYAYVRGKKRTYVESRVSQATEVETVSAVRMATPYPSRFSTWLSTDACLRRYIEQSAKDFSNWLMKDQPHVVFPVEGAAQQRREAYQRRKAEKTQASIEEAAKVST